MEYSDYNDYELLEFIAENNEDANNIIIQKYAPLINSIASKMMKNCNNNGVDYNDLVQEGYIGLDYALKHFSEEKNIIFYTYVKKCIERKIVSFLQSSTRLKHKVLNDSISYDNDDNMLDKVLTDTLDNPEIILENTEFENELLKKVRKKFTAFEQQVFDLMLSGCDYIEIAKILEKERKAIDNAIQRIRIKVKGTIKEMEI